MGPVTMAAWWYRASAMTGDPRGAKCDRGGVAQSHPPRKPKRLEEAKVSEASHGIRAEISWLTQNRARRARAPGAREKRRP